MKQKRKLGRKLLSFLLTLAMLVGLMPGMSLTVYAREALGNNSTSWTGDLEANNTVTINDNVTVTGYTFLYCTHDVTVNGSLTVNNRLVVYGPGKLYVNGNVVINSGQTLNVNAGDGTQDGVLVAKVSSGDCITGSGTLLVKGHVTASAGEDGVGIKGVSLICSGTLYGSDAAAINEENKKDSPYQKLGLRNSVDYESHRYMYVDDGLVDAQTLSVGDTFSTDLYGIKNCTSLTLQAGGYATERPMSSEPTPGTDAKIVEVYSNRVYFSQGKIMDRAGELSPYANGKVVNFWQVVSNSEGALVLTGYEISHTHNFTYSADSDTITATCGNDGCDLTDSKAILTIAAPTLTTYGGTESKTATLTGLSDFNTATGKTIVATDIKYVGRDGTSYEESGTAPTKGGKYIAKITLSGVKTGAGDNQSVTASVDYEIGWPDIYVAGNGTANNTAWVHGQNWKPGNADDKMSCTDGVYTISYKKVPAGSYEFKFAVNGTWDSSYGKESTTNFDLGVWNTVGAYNGEDTNIAFSLTEFTDIDIAFNIVEKKAKVDVKPSHTHSFTYSASEDTITAKCSATDCTLPPSSEGGTDHVATLSLVAPTLTTYGGTGDATATLDGVADFNTATGKTIATTDIKYVGRGSTTYAESSTAPTNAGTYTAKITVEEKTASLNYEIAKADPTANAPTGLTAKYGQTLSDVTLTNPTGNTDGTWAWVAAGTTSVGNAGDNTFKANFTPTDTNYKTVENVDVTITVGKAANPATVTGTATVIKGRNTVDLKDNVTKNGATGDAG